MVSQPFTEAHMSLNFLLVLLYLTKLKQLHVSVIAKSSQPLLMLPDGLFQPPELPTSTSVRHLSILLGVDTTY
uniref:Uncharacterized protein n=1 Tax=uncultured marine virus TaxID=186617 RepID=A0A0F7L911_9VIRU|nr:hypothetical protein [uncultured marine virus]